MIGFPKSFFNSFSIVLYPLYFPPNSTKSPTITLGDPGIPLPFSLSFLSSFFLLVNRKIGIWREVRWEFIIEKLRYVL